jgi:hypothetical protein
MQALSGHDQVRDVPGAVFGQPPAGGREGD